MTREPARPSARAAPPADPDGRRDLLWYFDADDAAQAEQKYRSLRRRAIGMLRRKGCGDDAEAIAAEVEDVLLARVDREERILSIEALYIAVLRFKVLEWHRRRKSSPIILTEVLPERHADQPTHWRFHECLRECLGRLARADRELIEAYHRGEPAQVAEELGIAPKTLRNRACALRVPLKECLSGCLHSSQAEASSFMERMARVFKKGHRRAR